MLGDLIYEGSGKTIGIRMLDNKGTIEMTLQEEGKILGVPCTIMSTLVATHRPDGTEFLEGQGIMFTKDGDSGSVNIYCVKNPKGTPPAGSIRGTTFFFTESPKLSRLNTIASIFEAELNEDMSYTIKDWEWK